MRRRLLGYKPADVDAALEARESELDELEGELDARDAELGELRQDIAALWLAFAQHDRMLAELRGTPAEAGEAGEAQPQPVTPDRSVGRQLADLDEVLTAIEMATQTLEQTYGEEIEQASDAEAEPESKPEGEPSSGD